MNTNEVAMAIGTARVVPTRVVRRVVIGTRVMSLRDGVTDANAHHVVEPYVRATAWTWGYAGPADDSTMFVVKVRGGDWKCAEKALNARIAKAERS